MRVDHKLCSVKKQARPRHVLVFDTETRQEKKANKNYHTFFIGYAKYKNLSENRDRSYILENKNDITDIIEDRAKDKTTLYVVGHNLVFDMTVTDLFNDLKKRGWELKVMADKNIFMAKAKKEKRSITFFDTYNICRRPLEEIGKWQGLPKIKVDFNKKPNRDLYQERCKHDVNITLSFFEKWIDLIYQNGWGSLKYSIAGQAFAAYRASYMTDEIFIHTNAPAIDLERRAYYGGRNEIFYRGVKHGKFYQLDINSAYPYIMSKINVPRKFIGYFKPTISQLINYLKKPDISIIAEVLIKTPAAIYPKREKDNLYFPVGSFKTVLCTPELRYAVAAGHVVKVQQIAIYKAAPLFKNYVESLFDLKSKAKTPIEKNIYKLMLNSLYGKFGQKKSEWEEIKSNNLDRYSDGKTIYHVTEGSSRLLRKVDDKLLTKKRSGETENSFPAIAAEITSAARLLLYKFMAIAGPENVYYVDTDSLIVNELGYTFLNQHITPAGDIGKLKIEQYGVNLDIKDIKFYRLDEKAVTKGINKDAKKISENKYKITEWPGYKKLLDEGLSEYYTIDVEKDFKFQYNKGTVLENGNVKPIELKEF